MPALQIDFIAALLAVAGTGNNLACPQNIKQRKAEIGQITNAAAKEAGHQLGCLWPLHGQREDIRFINLDIQRHANSKPLGPEQNITVSDR